jgi:hypothetical protein
MKIKCKNKSIKEDPKTPGGVKAIFIKTSKSLKGNS